MRLELGNGFHSCPEVATTKYFNKFLQIKMMNNNYENKTLKQKCVTNYHLSAQLYS
jgi:hypothetical protein